MWHIGIDLHRRTVVMAAVGDDGQAVEPKTFACRDIDSIREHAQRLRPFRAVIEATSTYRWLYDLSSQDGTVVLAHPTHLRLMTQRRAKTDKLDCQLLAHLLFHMRTSSHGSYVLIGPRSPGTPWRRHRIVLSCPFREVHLLASPLAGQALAFLTQEKVHGEVAAGCGEGAAVA